MAILHHCEETFRCHVQKNIDAKIRIIYYLYSHYIIIKIYIEIILRWNYKSYAITIYLFCYDTRGLLWQIFRFVMFL